jgi:hypothetical protein
LEEKPEEIKPRRGPGRPKGSKSRPLPGSRASTRRNVHLYAYLNDEEVEAFRRVCDYWGASKAEAIRTMIRYFDVNLGLNREAPRQ